MLSHGRDAHGLAITLSAAALAVLVVLISPAMSDETGSKEPRAASSMSVQERLEDIQSDMEQGDLLRAAAKIDRLRHEAPQAEFASLAAEIDETTRIYGGPSLSTGRSSSICLSSSARVASQSLQSSDVSIRFRSRTSVESRRTPTDSSMPFSV